MLVARELKYYPTEELEVQKKPRKSQKKVKLKKKRNNGLAKLMILSMPLFFLGIALLILFRYANITAVRQEITKLERQRAELEVVKQDLIGELEGIKSSTKISEDAITKLGMNYPEEGQVVYIAINENEMDSLEKVNKESPLKKLVSIFRNLF
ncbi:hypothetical protein RBU61_10380 [Tissierella sp. MB52-C2]|uniref:hypothetical protein n=1 Tax=Tissierella sp. MB52-C2 TaxID=3070999 RepID=UPI00280B4CA1|nr:hypothetical protein [Tissierella sp. MB52-C2]WMM23362.1 hypothetical protein RBU61_10380 [Tissierella sp. MB52-C2]